MILAQRAEAVKVSGVAWAKWAEKKLMALDLAKRMIEAGYVGRGERMAVCGEYIKVTQCENCGGIHITGANYCRDKICPICSWRLALQRLSGMSRIIHALQNGYPECEWSFLTLTVKNSRTNVLSETIKDMSAAWNRLMQRKIWKENVKGWARSVEITYNHTRNDVHPHFHVLIMWHGNVPMDGDAIIRAWREVYRGKTSLKGQDHREIKAAETKDEKEAITKAIIETFKYTQKTSDLMRMPISTLREYSGQIAGKRMISFGGIIKEYKKLCEAEMENVETEERDYCIDCGSKSLAQALYRWSFAACGYVPESLNFIE